MLDFYPGDPGSNAISYELSFYQEHRLCVHERAASVRQFLPVSTIYDLDKNTKKKQNKRTVFPCIPQFYVIKVGFKGIYF